MIARLRSASDDGLTLIEVLAAMLLFAIVAAATAGALSSGIRSSADSRNRTAAAGIAAEQLEKDRSVAVSNFTTLVPPGNSTFSYTQNNVTFTDTRTTAWVPKSTLSNGCDSSADAQGGNSGVQPVLLDTEKVTWPTMHTGEAPVLSQTTFTPPVGTYPGTGGLDIGAVNATNQPDAGLSLTVLNQSTNAIQTLTTDSNGCAFAAYLQPATYTVTLTAPSEIGINEAQAQTCTQTVNTTVMVCNFIYDTSSSINWSYQSGCTAGAKTYTAAQCPLVSGLNTVTIGNSQLNVLGQYPGTFTPVTASTPLFPFASGYNIWAGHCPAAATAAPPNLIAMTPGTASTAKVALYQMALAVTSKSGSTYKLTSVSVQENADSGATTCSGTQTYTFPAAALALSSVTAGVPLGNFIVTVTGTATAGSQKGATATVTVGTAAAPVSVTKAGKSVAVSFP